jgi:hypothetical protein
MFCDMKRFWIGPTGEFSNLTHRLNVGCFDQIMEMMAVMPVWLKQIGGSCHTRACASPNFGLHTKTFACLRLFCAVLRGFAYLFTTSSS